MSLYGADLPPANSLEDLPKWMQVGLEGQPPSVVKRFVTSPAVAKLDKALLGLEDSVRSDVLRVMLNLEVRPDDDLNIILGLMGNLKSIGVTSVQEIREAVSEVTKCSNDIHDETENLLMSIGVKFRDVTKESESMARSIAESSVKGYAAEEIVRFRERMQASAEVLVSRMIAAYKLEAQEVKGTDWKPLMLSLGVIGVAIVLACVLTWGAVSIGNRQVYTEAYQGRVYAQMFSDMPSQTKSWVRHWVSTHSVR